MKTTRYKNEELQFLDTNGKVVSAFVTFAVVPYNRLRELWIHNCLTVKQLKQKVKEICGL